MYPLNTLPIRTYAQAYIWHCTCACIGSYKYIPGSTSMCGRRSHSVCIYTPFAVAGSDFPCDLKQLRMTINLYGIVPTPFKACRQWVSCTHCHSSANTSLCALDCKCSGCLVCLSNTNRTLMLLGKRLWQSITTNVGTQLRKIPQL